MYSELTQNLSSYIRDHHGENANTVEAENQILLQTIDRIQTEMDQIKQ
jgi:hypothetical protein